MNGLRAKLSEAPWLYIGDRDIKEGGTAVSVNRTFGYANVVEATDLDSATGCAGATLLQVGSITLDRANLETRRRFRSAMETMGMTMASLRERHPVERWRRMAELGYAVWNYGFRDEEPSRVLVHDREAFDEACETGRFEGWQNDSEDCDDVAEAFMEALC